MAAMNMNQEQFEVFPYILYNPLMDQKNCQGDRKLPMSVGSSESHSQHLRYMDFPE